MFSKEMFLGIALLLSLHAHAHNGQTAIALPVAEIEIDGRADDWPSEFTKYSIGDDAHQEGSDLLATFRVGFNLQEQALYLLVEVLDDQHVQNSSFSAGQFEQDAHLLYLDMKHKNLNSGVRYYSLTSNSLRLLDHGMSWDPDVVASNLNQIRTAVVRKGKITTYEWKIFLGEELYVNRTIGLDHEIMDKDKAGVKKVSWGIFGWKNSLQNNLGDIYILEKDASSFGTLRGKTLLDLPGEEVIPFGLTFTNLDHPGLWTQVPLFGKQEVSIDLPPGEYTVQSALIGNVSRKDQLFSATNDPGIRVQIQANQTTEMPTYRVPAKAPGNFFSAKTGILVDFQAKDSSEVDQFFEKVLDFYAIPGMSMALIKNGQVVYANTYGESNLYTKEPVQPHSLFDAGSVTKPVFAFLVMSLVEDGLIDLDKPLYHYLPYEDIAHDTTYHQLTARHVLSHRTGFPNWRHGQLNFVNPPGTFGYSGEGFVYLSKVVERITHTDLESLLRERVLEPFGMEHTYFSTHPELLENLAFGHNDKYVQILFPAEKPNMAFSMNTHAMDFSLFLLGIMKKENLRPDLYEAMLTKQVDIPVNWSEANTDWKQGFGLGLQLKFSPYGFAYGHSGRNGGYDCSFEVYQDLDVAYVFFTNSSNGFRIKNTIREFLITGNKE